MTNHVSDADDGTAANTYQSRHRLNQFGNNTRWISEPGVTDSFAPIVRSSFSKWQMDAAPGKLHTKVKGIDDRKPGSIKPDNATAV